MLFCRHILRHKSVSNKLHELVGFVRYSMGPKNVLQLYQIQRLIKLKLLVRGVEMILRCYHCYGDAEEVEIEETILGLTRLQILLRPERQL